MKTPHVHAALIHSWADGAEIEYLFSGEWRGTSMPSWELGTLYRIKPEAMLVNGVECPKPTEDGRYCIYINLAVVPTMTLAFASRDDAVAVFSALVKPFRELK